MRPMLWMIAVLVVVGVAIVNCAPGPDKRGFKIFNGDKVKDWKSNPYKFVAAIAGVSLCSATVFNSLTLISAGHCFLFDPEPTKVVFAQTYLLSGMPNSIKIKEYFIREDFKANYAKDPVNGKDISVVRLESAIPMEKHDVTTLPLMMDSRPAIGSTLFIAGYGEDKHAGELSGTLKIGKMELIACGNRKINADPLCLTPVPRLKDQRVEGGDSGGPAFLPHAGGYIGVGYSSGYLTFKNNLIIDVFASTNYNKDHINKYTTG